MKKNSSFVVFCLLVCSLLLSQCSVGTHTDFTTGLSYSYKGFTVDEVAIFDALNNPKTNNKVPDKSSFAIIVSGLGNFKASGDKVHPGMMINVKDKDGISAVDEPDLFRDAEGYTAEEASVLRGSVSIGPPMKKGETYHVKMRIWDKNNPESELTAEIDILIE